ncbi:hypothetical protein D3C72_2411110 [compost metagenome]
MHGADLALLVAHHDDLGVTDRQFLDEVVARIGDLFHAADLQPCLLEDLGLLALVVLGRDIGLDRHRTFA